MSRARDRANVDFVVSETAPTAPFIGLQWYKATTGVIYQYTNDGYSSFWLDVSSGGIGTSASKSVDFAGDVDPHKSSATVAGGLVVGSVYYNRVKHKHFICTTATDDANVWSGRYDGWGGTVTEYLSGSTYYRVHTFLTSGIFIPNVALTVNYLVIGGGGSGGSSQGAGGGAGGYITSWHGAADGSGSEKSGEDTTPVDPLTLSLGQNYVVTVGVGGTSPGGNNQGGDGSPSTFSSKTSLGGGGGGKDDAVGRAGGSGGGGGYSKAGGAGTSNQGFAGGTGHGTSLWPTGGGGGAGAVGESPAGGGSADGEGGDGLSSSITGTSVPRAGGGGSVGDSASGSSGGTGGGGAGHATAGVAGGANTGSGGGGTGNTNAGGAGGKGVVIIRYKFQN